MATDAYIKFGEGSGESPYGTPLPLIEGDSTDETHYWWCELRGYDFSLEAGERDSSDAGDKSKEKSKPSFKKVTVKKRVDWASTQLFLRCCYAAEATARKLTGDQDRGLIDRVTIEICKQVAPAGWTHGKQSEVKFPYVTVRYFGVRIVGYSVDISGPEPSETISFVFEKLDVEYQPTDPLKGTKIDGAASRAIGMKNYAPTQSSTAKKSAVSVGGATTTVSGSTGAAVGAAASGGGGGADSEGAPAGNGAPATTEDAVNANYPGLWTGTGFGVLPD